MGPQSLQTREHIAVLRQLHLRLGISGLCAHGEDVEDETGAVENLHLQLLLDVAYLFCGEFVVEDHHADGLRTGAFLGVVQLLLPLVVCLLALLYVGAYLLQLTLADVCHAARSVHPLRETLHGDGPGGIGKKLQFVEVFLGLRLVLLRCDKTDEHRRLHLSF